MFTKSRSSVSGGVSSGGGSSGVSDGYGANAVPVPNLLEANPLRQSCEITSGQCMGTAGPDNVWHIYDGCRKENGQEVSIFFFDKRSVEKIHKPKRKEYITQTLRKGLKWMEKKRSHLKLLQMHDWGECENTLAFASDPVLATLANVLAYYERENAAGQPPVVPPKQNFLGGSHHPTTYVKVYELHALEIKYGLLQITEALLYLHESCRALHRNVCPSSIVITKRGTWKLFGFEFIEEIRADAPPSLSVEPWSNQKPKKRQPNLNYVAPEIQRKKRAYFSSDMYSFGMTICAIFNNGRPLIQANNDCGEYDKQLENLKERVNIVLPRIPVPLREAVWSLLQQDPDKRPSAQVLLKLKYFGEPVVHALQFLDICRMKEASEKAHFYTTTLKQLLPLIPQKIRYQHVWPNLRLEMESQEVLSAVLQPMLGIVEDSTQEEYERILFPTLNPLFSNPKSIQGTVTLLENLHVIVKKTPRQYLDDRVLPMLYQAFDNSSPQVQTAAFVALSNVSEYIDDGAVQTVIPQELLRAVEKDSVDARILIAVIPCILNRLEKQKIIDFILPLLCKVKLQNPEVVVGVVDIYRWMLTDKKYGLSVSWMATRAMPSLLPQTINPSLNLKQFEMLLEVLQDMLSHIEKNQRNNKITLDKLSVPGSERYRTLRHQYSTDNVHVPQFNIPNLRIEQRKTSSAENMARRNSIDKSSISMTASAENMARKNSMVAMLGGWFAPSSSSDKNLLNVAHAFTRRLSDNTLMVSKMRVAPSCASSPGGTPGGGFPNRRHSSIVPQERRGSSVNLSPPMSGAMPITSSSVPYLHSSSMNSVQGSRRTSVSSTSSHQGAGGSGFLQQVGSGMYQLFKRQLDG